MKGNKDKKYETFKIKKDLSEFNNIIIKNNPNSDRKTTLKKLQSFH